jgi:hypothetical protein
MWRLFKTDLSASAGLTCRVPTTFSNSVKLKAISLYNNSFSFRHRKEKVKGNKKIVNGK